MEIKNKIEGSHPGAGNEGTSAHMVSAWELKRLADCRCPICGTDLVFGSRDPCEGDHYWCDTCGNGPILYPLNYRRKFIRPIAPVIDADIQNAYLRGRSLV